MIFFFFKGCGHCKKLAPTWDQLGELLKNSQHVKIAKIDGDNNELHPRYGRSNSFPSLKLFKASNKTPISFDDKDRSLVNLLKFLRQNSE